MITVYADQTVASRTLSRMSRAFIPALDRACGVANHHATTTPSISRLYAHFAEDHQARFSTPIIAHCVARLTCAVSRPSRRSPRRAKPRVYQRAVIRRVVRAKSRDTPRCAYAPDDALISAPRRAFVYALRPAYRWACCNAC